MKKANHRRTKLQGTKKQKKNATLHCSARFFLGKLVSWHRKIPALEIYHRTFLVHFNTMQRIDSLEIYQETSLEAVLSCFLFKKKTSSTRKKTHLPSSHLINTGIGSSSALPLWRE
jgi:hypothetical protein